MRVLFFILLLTGSALGEHTPVGFKKWYNGGDSYSKQFSGAVRNYQTGQTWAPIVNNFVTEGDSVFYVDESVIKPRVNKNGTSSSTLVWDGQDYVVTQKLLGIGWLKISTRGRQWIDNTMNFSNISVDSNIITWTGISPGVDYRVRKGNGQVEHGIFFKPAFLDSAVMLYNQRADSSDIALANVMVYTLSGNIDNADSGLGEFSERQLKSFGEYKFKLTDEGLNYPGSDTLRTIPIKKFGRKRNDSIFCIEYVMMSDVKRIHGLYPSNVIWHNDTKKIEGTTNVEDNRIEVGNNTFNMGGADFVRVDLDVASALIRPKNIASEIGAGATITGVICSLWIYDRRSTAASDVSVYRVFKPWIEGAHVFEACVTGDTWDDWDCTTLQWGTAGCECANDDGVDNSQDGTCDASGRDRKATAESTISTGNVDGEWAAWTITNALGQAWYDGTANEEGILIRGDSDPGDFLARSTEYATASERPFFVFTYTVSSGNKVMIRK